MLNWLARFSDADPAEIRAALDWWVYRGRYTEGPLSGKPVAPTVEAVNRRGTNQPDQ